MEIITKEFNFLYKSYRKDNEGKLKPLKKHYKDYAAWHNKLINDEKKMLVTKEFWKTHLSGDLDKLNLPYNYPRSNLRSKESNEYRIVISEELTQKLRIIAKKNGVSLFMLLLAGFNLLLSRICGQEDIIIGAPGAGRLHEDLRNMIGFFVNTLIIRNKINMDETFTLFLERVRANMLQILEFQSFPLELICSELKIEFPEIPLFFNMLNITDSNKEYLKDFDSYHIEFRQEARFEIECYITEYKNGIDIKTHYYKELFERLTIEKMIQMYTNLLENISVDPNRIIKGYFKRRKKIGYS
jgi:hypothetical protein